MFSYAILTANFAGPARPITRDGKAYISAPMTMLIESVLHGSAGPLFYSAAEIARSVPAWNGVPLTLGHPFRDGQAVSARMSGVLDEVGLGLVAQPAAERGALRATALFDVAAVQRLHPALLDDLHQGRRVEVSTGLFSEHDATPGTYNNVAYHAIARNILPDHLAVLVHARGACAIADGCGIFNHLGETPMRTDSSHPQFDPDDILPLPVINWQEPAGLQRRVQPQPTINTDRRSDDCVSAYAEAWAAATE